MISWPSVPLRLANARGAPSPSTYPSSGSTTSPELPPGTRHSPRSASLSSTRAEWRQSSFCNRSPTAGAAGSSSPSSSSCEGRRLRRRADTIQSRPSGAECLNDPGIRTGEPGWCGQAVRLGDVWHCGAMHILVATDGHLDADKATGLIARLHQSGDAVTLLTAVDHPREFLGDYASFSGVDEVAKIAHEAGPGVIALASGAKAAERLTATSSSTPPHQLNEYFTTTAQRRLRNLLQRLDDRGIEATAAWSPTENQTARTILEIRGARERRSPDHR